MCSNISSGPMKKIVVICIFAFFTTVPCFSATWRSCGSGTWGTNSGNTTLTFSKDGGACVNPYNAAFVVNDNDVLIFDTGHTITIAANISFTADDLLVEFNGSVIFNNGKMELTETSELVLNPGSSLTCTGADCGNNNQITVGDYQYKGDDLEIINDAPRPSTVDDSGSILPVSISAYTIQELSNGAVEVSWTTISEENFDRFVIQRSGNGQDYYDIGERKGQGQNIYELESRYVFEDLTPLIGYNYYRLKAVDIDNSFEYFGPKVARVKADKALTVFPNPGEGKEITYYANFNPEEGDRLVLRNSVGMVLYSDLSPKSFSTINLSSMKLSAGLYFLEYIGAENKQVVRVFVK